jgi:hypothetical protein
VKHALVFVVKTMTVRVLGSRYKKDASMNCEEFELIGLGLDRESATNGAVSVDRRSAREHASTCPRCAALQESWLDAQGELQALREATQEAGAPLRVEMRLRQEFHTRHRTLKVRAAAVVAAWALAGAALLVGAVSWWNWHIMRTVGPAENSSASAAKSGVTPAVTTASGIHSGAEDENNANDAAGDTTMVAENDAEDFTLLPGSMPQETGEAAVVRVRMQRGALGALGLPVNETRAGEWIQVDLFVGQDGQPQAFRLPQ